MLIDKYDQRIDQAYIGKVMPLNRRLPPNPIDLCKIDSIYMEMTKD